MIDVGGQLREYAAFIEDELGPVDLAGMRSSARLVAHRRRRGPAIAFAAAFVTVLAIGAAMLLGPPGTEVPVVDSPTTLTTTATTLPATTTIVDPTTTEATATTVIAPAAFAWERISDPVLDEVRASTLGWPPGSKPPALIVHDGEFLAVGGFDGGGSLWRSADGMTWTRTTDPALAGIDLVDVVAYRDGLLVIGNTPFVPQGPVPDPFVAFSADGESWEVVDTSDPNVFLSTRPPPYTGPLRAVAVAGDRVIVVGTHIWRSNDVRTWRLAEDLGGAVTAIDVVASDRGIVAVGSSLSSAFAWYSADGEDWEQVPIAVPAATTRMMFTVEATASGFVAGGLVGDDAGQTEGGGFAAADAAVWVSTNGVDWGSATDGEGQFGGEHGQWIQGITDTGTHLVAVGMELNRNWQAQRGAIWESEDGGATWRRVASSDNLLGSIESGAVYMNTVVFHEGRLLAVGYVEGALGEGSIAVWEGTPAD